MGTMLSNSRLILMLADGTKPRYGRLRKQLPSARCLECSPVFQRNHSTASASQRSFRLTHTPMHFQDFRTANKDIKASLLSDSSSYVSSSASASCRIPFNGSHAPAFTSLHKQELRNATLKSCTSRHKPSFAISVT